MSTPLTSEELHHLRLRFQWPGAWFHPLIIRALDELKVWRSLGLELVVWDEERCGLLREDQVPEYEAFIPDFAHRVRVALDDIPNEDAQ